MWNQLSNSLLENNHIKIPIQKRFFLSFIEDDETNINKEKILNELIKHGFLNDDPRLKELRNRFKILVKTQSINYDNSWLASHTQIISIQSADSYYCSSPTNLS